MKETYKQLYYFIRLLPERKRALWQPLVLNDNQRRNLGINVTKQVLRFHLNIFHDLDIEHEWRKPTKVLYYFNKVVPEGTCAQWWPSLMDLGAL